MSMAGAARHEQSDGGAVGGRGSVRAREWKRFLRGPDPELLDELYVPALREAVRYDRCCAYFSSTVLAAAARGFGALIARLEALGDSAPRPAVRLIVNEELPEEDARALTETGDVARLEVLLDRRFRTPKENLEKQRLAMLGWLVKRGLLGVRVGVMRRGEGIVHAKFGIMTDAAGDAIVFAGSGNETAQGLLGNYERLEVSTSWQDSERFEAYVGEFEGLWQDKHEDVHTVPLPEALRLRLVKLAPSEPPIVEPSSGPARQRSAMLWQYIASAPYFPGAEATCDATALVDLWPHQRRVVEETSAAWPSGRLLCDEVGMGKTMEAIVVLRRLLAGRGVRRVLVLLPAGLLRQWQGELREKGGLCFPRLENSSALVWPDERIRRIHDIVEALDEPCLIMSRETARTESNLAALLNAKPWDLVILDESHAARRRKQEEGEFNTGTLLLNLLRELQLRRRARGFMLLSATPMQTHPWEPWDLVGVLGEGGVWLSDFAGVRSFYHAVAAVRAGRCGPDSARRAASLVLAAAPVSALPGADAAPESAESIERQLTFVPASQRDALATWLKGCSPLTRRMHRTTRTTLRSYYELGLIDGPPPTRRVRDHVFDLGDRAERQTYDAVTRYIDRRFAELERERPGKGFVMTIYRRRASSSPLALERSLARRAEGLERVAERKAFNPTLEAQDALDTRDTDDLGDFESPSGLSAAFPDDPQIARAELRDVEELLAKVHEVRGRDRKREEFFEVLRDVTEDGRPALVFTEYTDTLEYLRDSLVDFYGSRLGCYSGDGGQIWDGKSWRAVTKDAITRALQDGNLGLLVCTDAASEGLNLQAAGAVVNYDLPWNPSKVEQRIGRIDRIGQKHRDLHVVNMLLRHSVDDRVYRVLRERCGLFEHFVGSMQPVLGPARRMLLGQDSVDTSRLESAAAEVERDPLNEATYVESAAVPTSDSRPLFGRRDLEEALRDLPADAGLRVRHRAEAGVWEVGGETFRKARFAASVAALERDKTLLPLTPLEPRVRELAEALLRPGERLPLVIGSSQVGSCRVAVALWLAGGVRWPIGNLAELRERLAGWDGRYPDPAEWVTALDQAGREAKRIAAELDARAAERVDAALAAQVLAARMRLQRELGRYLVALGADGSNLNERFHGQMLREISSADRLRRTYDRLGGYPEWSADDVRELEEFARGLTDGHRKGRLLGTEVDAALDDPRWAAAGGG